MKMNLGRNLQVVKTVSVFKREKTQLQFIHSAPGVSGPSNWRGSESAVFTPPLYWVASIDHAAGHVTRRCSLVKCYLHEVPGCRETADSLHELGGT